MRQQMEINPLERVRRLRAAKPKANLGAGVDRQRVPPGQWVTARWPVLHCGLVPEVALVMKSALQPAMGRHILTEVLPL